MRLTGRIDVDPPDAGGVAQPPEPRRRQGAGEGRYGAKAAADREVAGAKRRERRVLGPGHDLGRRAERLSRRRQALKPRHAGAGVGAAAGTGTGRNVEIDDHTDGDAERQSRGDLRADDAGGGFLAAVHRRSGPGAGGIIGRAPARPDGPGGRDGDEREQGCRHPAPRRPHSQPWRTGPCHHGDRPSGRRGREAAGPNVHRDPPPSHSRSCRSRKKARGRNPGPRTACCFPPAARSRANPAAPRRQSICFSSTRRFRARPSAVPLSAIDWVEPYPFHSRRDGAIPLPIK